MKFNITDNIGTNNSGPKVPVMDLSEGKILAIDTVSQNRLNIIKNHMKFYLLGS